MNTLARASLLRAALVVTTLFGANAHAQLLSVPTGGDPNNTWVKQLKIELDQNWEWIDTIGPQVFFATRLGAERNGDIVTMWMRVEYREPQRPGNYRSVASKDEWDCRQRRRATLGVLQHRYNNLADTEPTEGRNAFKNWESVPKGTMGEALLEFACSITVAQQVPAAAPATKPAARPQR